MYVINANFNANFGGMRATMKSTATSPGIALITTYQIESIFHIILGYLFLAVANTITIRFKELIRYATRTKHFAIFTSRVALEHKLQIGLLVGKCNGIIKVRIIFITAMTIARKFHTISTWFWVQMVFFLFFYQRKNI